MIYQFKSIKVEFKTQTLAWNVSTGIDDVLTDVKDSLTLSRSPSVLRYLS